MVAAIILNYKTWETTIKCIESIQRTSCDVKIYVVDNCSPNNCYEILLAKYKKHPDVKVFKTNKNLGYARGNNFGANMAINDGHDILLFSNNDIIFEEKTIKRMADSLRNNQKISCVAPLIKSLTGSIESLPIISPISTCDYLLSYTRLNKILKFVKTESPVEKNYELKISKENPLKEIYRFSGCCFMIRSDVFEAVGFFDEETFMYFEEDILCHKLNEKGYKSYHISDAIIQHHHGKTTGNNNYFVDSEMFKSEIYYFSKYRKTHFINLIYLYFDRVITPPIKATKNYYTFSLKEYKSLIRTTINTIIKYKFKHRNNQNMEEWNK